MEIMNFDVMTVSDYAEKGYLVECSLSYPAYLHDEHNCFPLASIKRIIKDEELSPYAKEAWNLLRNGRKKDLNRKVTLYPRRQRLLCATLSKFKAIFATRTPN